MTSRAMLAALLLGAAICAGARTSAAQTPVAAAETIVPRVDHHQHLWSPQSVAPAAQLPAIELPPELATLLRQRAERFKDFDALEQLYTDNAAALGIRNSAWATGAAASARAMGWIGGQLYFPYRLTPVFYRERGGVARIAGYYTQGEGAQARHMGAFQIVAERGDDGRWRIAGEMPRFFTGSPFQPFSADELIAMLDEAGIRKAVVLSMAYSFDGLDAAPGDPYAAVRAENDWVAEQVMRYPDRLVGFCSFNPTRDHALAEIERCAGNPAFKGVKLHFGTSPVDLDNPAHVAATRRVFQAANRLGLPIQVHLAASPEWGARQATTFLNELVAAAPDVQVVVAHLWGGAGYKDDALSVLADAVASGNPVARNLYFDVTQAAEVVRGDTATLQRIAAHMRRIGMNRFYYGSDSPRGAGIPPKQSWARFHSDVPLTEDEFRIIANNVAPWAR
jgi:predicted TIM-barrel fold metal-dependent hydrolase